MMLSSSRRTATIITAIAMVVIAPTTAYATDAHQSAGVQKQITAHLAAFPGGTQINSREISYAGGTFIMTFGTSGSRVAATPSCTIGWFCFYELKNYGGLKGKLSSCGWQDLGWYGWRNRVDSAFYNDNDRNGFVSFYNIVGSGDEHLFTISTASPRRASVDPNGNKADLVYRYC